MGFLAGRLKYLKSSLDSCGTQSPFSELVWEGRYLFKQDSGESRRARTRKNSGNLRRGLAEVTSPSHNNFAIPCRHILAIDCFAPFNLYITPSCLLSHYGTPPTPPPINQTPKINPQNHLTILLPPHHIHIHPLPNIQTRQTPNKTRSTPLQNHQTRK